MLGRWEHPESVCGCLHDYAVAVVEDTDLRSALLRGISETGVPTIENEWCLRKTISIAAFTKVAKPTLQCMFEPWESASSPVHACDVRAPICLGPSTDAPL